MGAIDWNSFVALESAWAALAAMYVVAFLGWWFIALQNADSGSLAAVYAFLAMLLAVPTVIALYVLVRFVKWAWSFQLVADAS
jgi:hypothetical protein